METSASLRALVVGLLALLGYLLVAQNLIYDRSIAPYFLNLAEAFLQGRPYLSLDAISTYDLVSYGGRWYVAQPPLPAMLLVPFVALTSSPSDVFFDVLIGVLSVVMCERVLRAAAPGLGLWPRLALTAFFGFGTAQLYLTTMGTVWFLGQACAVLALWLFLAMVIAKCPLWAGLALGLVILARPSIVPGAVVLALIVWDAPQMRLRRAIPFLAPLVLFGAFALAYNAMRFSHPLDFGYSYINDSPAIRERRLMHGSFSVAFLPENAYVATVKPPAQLDIDCLTNPECAVVTPDLWGLGLLWTNPLLLVGVLAGQSRLGRAAMLAAGLVILPSLLYHNTGSAQFGYRFSLDALPIWLLAVALAVQRWSGRRWVLPATLVSVLYSVGVTVVGTLWLMGQLTPQR